MLTLPSGSGTIALSAEAWDGASTANVDRIRRRPLIFRWPAPRYLVAGDTAMFALSAIMFRQTDFADLGALVVLIGCFHARGLYKSRISRSVLDDLPSMLGGLAISAVAADWSNYVMDDVVASPAMRALRALVLVMAVVGFRLVAYTTIKAARRSGRVRHNTLILGAGNVGTELAEALQTHRGYGLEPVGFLDNSPRFGFEFPPPAPLLGGYEQLPYFIRTLAARVVIVAYGGMPESELVRVLRTCDRLDCEMLVVPRFYEMHHVTRDTDQVRGLPLIRIQRAPFRASTWRMKRVFDFVLAGLALMVLSPVLLACAVAVRLESGPGFLFRQERVGLDGRTFTLLKFRSLRPATEEESATTWNIATDERVGRVGKVLRRTSLDELPQLWNVFVGDMSLVGPRPERPHFVEEFTPQIPHYTARHRVPPGLSGWAQVHGLRGDTSIEDRASFDNHYIENWSLWGDVKILLRTAEHVLQRNGS
jgi:exopolysaccharide biosynthesis polyprenyl glycosylphosphotransferase